MSKMSAMPRRSGNRRKKRGSRKSQSLGRLILRLWAIPRVRQTVILLLGIVLTINLAVRFFGRSPAFPLSPFHLVDKSRALLALARHHAVGRAQPSPAEVRTLLRTTAVQHRVPASLALAVAEVESGFIPVRISPAGAMGLMQLMPGTAGDLGVDNPYDARDNMEGGVRYLARLSSRYRGDWRRVAAAYNAGPGNVSQAGPLRVRGETSDYVAKVMRRFAFYQSLEPRPARQPVLKAKATPKTPKPIPPVKSQ